MAVDLLGHVRDGTLVDPTLAVAPAVAPDPAAPVEPGVAERSAQAAPRRMPTEATARAVRARAGAEAALTYRIDHARRRTPGLRPRQKDPPRPLSAQDQRDARRALAEELPVSRRHTYRLHQQQFTTRLDRLGLPHTGADRIHVDEGSDRDLEHGRSVVRTAVGRVGLARGAQVTLHAGPVPESVVRRELPREAADRFMAYARAELQAPQNPGLDELVRSGADEMEMDVVEKRLRLAELRGELGRTGAQGRTFVNLSWGSSPSEIGVAVAQQMMQAPAGLKLRREATAALGHPPPRPPQSEAEYERYQRDVDKLQRELILPRLAREMAAPEQQRHLAEARTGLAEELARGRQSGILVFEATTNSYLDALRAGDVAASRGATDGTPGLMSVGAIDLHGPGPRDDTVASFSGDGRITIGAPGVKIPVGANRDDQDIEGTSFASPYAASIAYRMAAANSNLSVDQIAALMTDPRAARDIPGTTRDGAGHVDPFRAILLARNPNLTAADLDRAWRVAGGKDEVAVRRLAVELRLR